jgi:3D (Asp-Asp-Asp) domain-containing protein
MTRLPTISTLPRLGRVALVAAFSAVSITVFGAKAATDNSAPRTTARQTSTKAESASQELMHEIEPSAAKADDTATLASAVLPALTVQKTRVVMMLVTAYCPCTKCCGSHAQGLTASGKPVSFNGGHFVAADTRLYHFGTKVQIPGYADGQAVEVADKGGAIKGNHIDVFFPTHDEARQWGRKWVAVTLAE